jgi:hypothetical protein
MNDKLSCNIERYKSGLVQGLENHHLPNQTSHDATSLGSNELITAKKFISLCTVFDVYQLLGIRLCNKIG